jgi:hypothetical protein
VLLQTVISKQTISDLISAGPCAVRTTHAGARRPRKLTPWKKCKKSYQKSLWTKKLRKKMTEIKAIVGSPKDMDELLAVF